jgi:hypothetical protein
MVDVAPLRYGAVNLRDFELAELTPAERKAHFAECEGQMFADENGKVQRDRKGRPMERGLGAPGNETRQCLEAMKGVYGIPRDNPRRDEILAEYESRLIATEERRRAERGGDQAEEI